MDVSEQGQLSHQQAVQHWYYRAQYNFLVQFIQSLPLNRDELRLADFGCGLGLYLSMLEEDHILAPKQMCGIDKAYHNSATVRGGSTVILPEFPREAAFNVILLMHVLEHIVDDVSALKNVASHCMSGGYLFITVPAFRFLWSDHDVFLGHQRRYTIKGLRQLVEEEESIRLISIHYYYASIFPIVILVRWLKKRLHKTSESDLKPTNRILNSVLLKILNTESDIAHYNHVLGLSAVAICQKQ